MALMSAYILAAALMLTPQAQDAPTELSDVYVSGDANVVEQSRGFLEELSASPLNALSLATWQKPLCLQIVNLQDRVAGQIAAQVRVRAAEVGVEVQSAGCVPNVSILATSDGRFTASDLVGAFRSRFIASSGPTQGDGRALARFATADVPVRWWPISALVDDFNGRVLVPIWGGPATVSDTNGEMALGQNRREAFLTTLVILDLSKTGTVSAEALGDYVAMVILAPVDPDARGNGRPTILGLWDEGNVENGLTAWDRAYLKALYEAPVRLNGSVMQTRSLYQRREMARIMARELRGEAADAP
ncbi:hypothetical protein BZG35_11030 [Brevundimonas sp. LM2]|uniref:hypothetical protein n=1 Tax=Brevundimonas sp. LM2 TaxID=1938605 RepID=UPI0009838EEC|nr:hypothetical protein [Brevundimonas sp. LM2]AQR62117.1 hypothetical protein BZG35_11030 [Brevundimonas sp. LM2]